MVRYGGDPSTEGGSNNAVIVQGYRLPIIFVTAFSGMRARAQALAVGAIGFLDKPFSDEELIACLNKALAANDV